MRLPTSRWRGCARRLRLAHRPFRSSIAGWECSTPTAIGTSSCLRPAVSSVASPISACHASTSVWEPASCCRSWRRPARTSSASIGVYPWSGRGRDWARRSRAKATSTRRSAWRRGRSSPSGSRQCSIAVATQGTSSTSATGCCLRPLPTRCGASSSTYANTALHGRTPRMLNGTPSVSEQIGVLVMAYGTPATLADVETYYTHIRRGRPPEAAQLRELIGRYQAIGGSSPLLEISRAQATGLQTQLEAKHGGHFQVELGMKHAPPFIEDGVKRLIEAAVQRAVGMVLAPHYSPLSVGEYLARARNAAGEALDLSFVEDWHLASSYIDLLAERISESLSHFPVEIRDEVDVVFTAHSLPAHVLRSDDPYPQQLGETAEAVASTIHLPPPPPPRHS